MSVDWRQIGVDFQQKYESTYCRYTSPLTRAREVFVVQRVEVHNDGPPRLTLWNPKHGEIYLNYDTEAELDFSFPEMGYFQHGKTALRACRGFERQWKKGMCHATLRIVFPYDSIREVYHPPLTEEFVNSAFKPFERKSIDGAKKLLDDEKKVSVPLTKTMALGVGNKVGDYWLWFEDEPIGIIQSSGYITLRVPTFQQEVRDYLRDTGDHARTIL